MARGNSASASMVIAPSIPFWPTSAREDVLVRLSTPAATILMRSSSVRSPWTCISCIKFPAAALLIALRLCGTTLPGPIVVGVVLPHAPQAGGVDEIERIVHYVAIEVPALGHRSASGIKAKGVWGHEAAHGGGVVAGTEVIQARLAIAFFAGVEVGGVDGGRGRRGGAAARACGEVAFAEREEVVAVGGVGGGHVGEEARRAEMVVVGEIGGGVGVFRDALAVEIDVAARPAGGTAAFSVFGDDIAAQIVGILRPHAGGRNLGDTAAQSVVDVAGSGRGGVALRRAVARMGIDLDQAVLGVIEIVMGAIEDDVACRVVLIAVVDRIKQLIFCVHAGMELAAGAARGGLVGAVAPGVVGPGQAGAAAGVGWRRHRAQAIERIVRVAAIEIKPG